MNKLPKNFVVIDVETSGLDCEKHALLEIGAVKATGEMFFETLAMPRGLRVDECALAINGIDPIDLGNGVDVGEGIAKLFQFLEGENKRWIMGGKNPTFDLDFLEHYWGAGDVGMELKEVISRRCVDLHSLMYGEGLKHGVDMAAKDFNSGKLYEGFFNIPPEPRPHNAIRGAVHEMACFMAWARGRALGDVERAHFDNVMESLERDSADCVNREMFDFNRMRIVS